MWVWTYYDGVFLCTLIFFFFLAAQGGGLNPLNPPPPRRSATGGTSICMHIGYVPQERPPFSALNFRSGAYHFHKFPKNPFRSITILHFWADFAVPETIIFKIYIIFNPFIASHGRLSPNAAPRVSQTRPGSSGESQFSAPQGGRRLARRVLAVPEGLCRKGG